MVFVVVNELVENVLFVNGYLQNIFKSDFADRPLKFLLRFNILDYLTLTLISKINKSTKAFLLS